MPTTRQYRSNVQGRCARYSCRRPITKGEAVTVIRYYASASQKKATSTRLYHDFCAPLGIELLPAHRKGVHLMQLESRESIDGDGRNMVACREHDWLPTSRICGVRICSRCDEHEGLARCFCGWNLAPGERLDDDIDD